MTKKRKPKQTKRSEELPLAGWERLLLLGPKGGIKACLANAVVILVHHPMWRGVVAYDEFANNPISVRAPKWHAADKPERCAPGPWTQGDTLRLCGWLTRTYGVDFSPPIVDDAITVLSEKTRVHPVRDWLSSLTWDKKPRLDDWLIRIAGATDTPYVRAVSSKWMISAVARIYQAGCKVDHVLILEGDQGIGKSSLLRELAGDDWFLETAIDLGSKDAQQVLWRKWIVELSELDSLSRSEISRVKGFISERVSTFRSSYGKRAADYPRQCVFAGTTNSISYLKDDSGARRFWPVKLEKAIDLKVLRKEREQLWAESVARYEAHERWHFEDTSLIQAAAVETEERRQADPWESLVAGYINKNAAKGVTTNDVLTEALELQTSCLSRAEEMRVGAILRVLRWVRKKERRNGVLAWVYRPPVKLVPKTEQEGTEGTRKPSKKAVPSTVPTVPTILGSRESR